MNKCGAIQIQSKISKFGQSQDDVLQDYLELKGSFERATTRKPEHVQEFG
jgi:hypothetical protein